jgi:hypothetical protein
MYGIYGKVLLKTVVNSDINNEFSRWIICQIRKIGNKWNKMVPEAFSLRYTALWYYFAKLLIILERVISKSNGRYSCIVRLHALSLSSRQNHIIKTHSKCFYSISKSWKITKYRFFFQTGSFQFLLIVISNLLLPTYLTSFVLCHYFYTWNWYAEISTMLMKKSLLWYYNELSSLNKETRSSVFLNRR